jgi:hypothetical protein
MEANREVSDKAWVMRLEAHPELLSRVERILDLVEDKEGDGFRASEVEERAIREINALWR